mmetsp:Transcript_37408/g.74185  ORF Transcript_37408/g.74185 Transcript_37408/m.74185 type:complete len:136 (-) Transcript_37408:734-1141(-)
MGPLVGSTPPLLLPAPSGSPCKDAVGDCCATGEVQPLQGEEDTVAEVPDAGAAIEAECLRGRVLPVSTPPPPACWCPVGDVPRRGELTGGAAATGGAGWRWLWPGRPMPGVAAAAAAAASPPPCGRCERRAAAPG